jgi:betaine-aldehyde dehydrogenase
MLIDGERHEGSGAPVSVLNPATEETITDVPSADAGEVDAAVRSSKTAFEEWKRTPAVERGELLHGLSTWINEHTESLAETLTREGGKPLVENRDEMGWSANCFDFYAELGRTERGRVVPSGEQGQLSLVLKEPYGVVTAIVPWNYPILLLAWKLAPALAAGNTVVVKPSPYTPLSTLELSNGFAEIFPPGVVNVVPGEAEVGRALTTHPDVSLIAFTGSVETGKEVMRSAVDTLTKVHLELGGKDAFIVCDDVDIEVAAKGAVWAAFLNTGQVCTSAERFYVLDKVYGDFVDAVVAETGKLVVGDPFQDSTDIGPMVRGVQRDKVEAQVAAAKGAGASVLAGGGHENFERGFFMAPTVVVDVDESMELFSRETFGPVAPIAKVSSLQEAIERTNSSEYGLGANVYTRRLDYMLQAMEEIQAGTIWFNDPLTDNEAAPFGGMKSSGNGRELGVEGLEDFRQSKHVHIDTKMDVKSWWYPYSEYVRHQAEHGTAPG